MDKIELSHLQHPAMIQIAGSDFGLKVANQEGICGVQLSPRNTLDLALSSTVFNKAPCFSAKIQLYVGLVKRKPDFVSCEQQRCRLACASVQSDQHLNYSHSGNSIS